MIYVEGSKVGVVGGMEGGVGGQVRLGKKCRTDEVSSDRERAVVGTKDGRKDVKEEE